MKTTVYRFMTIKQAAGRAQKCIISTDFILSEIAKISIVHVVQTNEFCMQFPCEMFMFACNASKEVKLQQPFSIDGYLNVAVCAS